MKDTGILNDFWYVLGPAKRIGDGKLETYQFLGERIIVFRDRDRKIHALKDLCPHRGIPLSFGQLVNQDNVECPYHGWQFAPNGECVLIPSLTADQKMDCRKIKLKRFAVQEKWGLIWIASSEGAPYFPDFPDLAEMLSPQWTVQREFPCHVDQAVIGLMDPAHGPFVHQSKLWRTQKSVYEKQKKFGPIPFGFRMLRHEPSKNSKAYKILGGEPTTEISFQLPALRTESIHVGALKVFSFTALLPIDEKTTIVWQFVYWNRAWLGLLRPILSWFGNRFLDQDLDAVRKQQIGLAENPTLMLINDADTQAKWYYKLKTEWTASLAENREFQNPIRETVLRWRS